MNTHIANTKYADDAHGWHQLAQNSHAMSAQALANICRWNDRNGEWDYDSMLSSEGMTIKEAHTECRDQIIAWAEEQ